MRLAFTSIHINAQGQHTYVEGSLFSLPPELCDQFRMSRYLELKNLGWSKSEFGYMAYMVEDGAGNRLIIPGLYLTDGARPAKKIHGYKPQFSAGQIENYVKSYLSLQDDARRSSEYELTALVHDLRHLSSSIYHSAVEAENASRSHNWSKTADGIKTIIASQTMLKVRIDYLDFSNSVDRFDEAERIPVYSRVDKVIRCFKAAANDKNIFIDLAGESYRLASGPNILDIAPYTLIENAIKYSPNNKTILVSVADRQEDTIVSITSVGPKIKEGEVDKIFDPHFRGEHAVKVRSTGTGQGLSVARRVIEAFNGDVSVSQAEETEFIGEIPYSEITFLFRVPTSGEDERRRQKFAQTKRRRKVRHALR